MSNASPDWLLGLHARLDAIESRVVELAQRLEVEDSPARDREYRDILLLLDRITNWIPKDLVHIEARRPVALLSHDHIHPRGTAQDNTRYPRFVRACERVLGMGPLSVLDVGCAGGGLVLDFIFRGHTAFGIEGSDFSEKEMRAEWRVLENNLFTADATQEFRLRRGDAIVACDVVCAWEVMEHIPEEGLPQFLDNVAAHLKKNGLFMGSVAMFPDSDPATGAVWHVTLHERQWWASKFLEHGFEILEESGFQGRDFPRGTPHGRYTADFLANPDMGFHFVARRSADLR